MRQGGRDDDGDGTLAFKKKRLKAFWKKRIRNESKRVNAVGSDTE